MKVSQEELEIGKIVKTACFIASFATTSTRTTAGNPTAGYSHWHDQVPEHQDIKNYKNKCDSKTTKLCE